VSILENKSILYLYSQMAPREQDNKILFGGGAQKKTFEIASYFATRGFKVFFGSDDLSGSKIAEYMKSHGMEFLRIPFRSGNIGQALCLPILMRAVIRHHITLIHCNDRKTAMFGYIASLLARRPMIYTARNTFEDKKLSSLFWGKNIIAVSEAVKNNLVNFFGISPKRIRVIYNGTSIQPSDESERLAIKRELGLKDDDRVVSVIGRLSEQKGLTYLLHALTNVVAKHPEIRVLLVGEGEQKEELIELSKRLKIESNLRFCGYRKNVDPFIDISEFTVVPSIWEGMPGSVIESVVLGKPVVGTTVGGIPEIIEPEVNGLLVPPGKPAELASAICHLLDNPHKIHIMGKNAKKVGKEKFQISRMLEEYENYYVNVVPAFKGVIAESK